MSYRKQIRSLLLLLGFSAFSAGAIFAYPSPPQSLANDTFFLTISNVNGITNLPSLYFIIDDVSGTNFRKIGSDGSVSSGTYSYTTLSTPFTLELVDMLPGNMTNFLNFLDENTGTFISVDSSANTNSGTFVLASSPAPLAVSGLTFNFTISSGLAPMSNSGTFSLTTDLSGTNFYLSGNSTSFLESEFTFDQEELITVTKNNTLIHIKADGDEIVRLADPNSPAGTYSYTALNQSTAYMAATDTNSSSAAYLHSSIIFLGYTAAGSGTFAVQSSAGGYQMGTFTVTSNTPAPFFSGQDALGAGVYYLQFTNSTSFGYYNMAFYPYVYHYDMGWEYLINANDTSNGVYLYDFGAGHIWFTAPNLFPYLYDFGLNAWLYYYPNTTNSQRYTTDPRYFYNFSKTNIISQ